MPRLLRLLRALVVVPALVVVALAGAALIFEATGGVERLLRQQLDGLVAEEPDLEIDFRRARVDWTTPALALEGLHLVGGQGELYLESLELFFDLSEDAPSRLHGVDVGRGRVVIERAFSDAVLRTVARLQAELTGDTTEPDPLTTPEAVLPTIGLGGLEVALRLPDGELIELGQGEARLELEDQDVSLRGSVALPQGPDHSQDLHFSLRVEPSGTARLSAATRNLEFASRTTSLRRFLPPALQGLDFSGRASADLETVLVRGRAATTTAHLRLERGYLRAGEDLPALEDLELVGDLTWQDPPEGLELWRGGQGHASFTAGVLGETLSGGAQVDGAGLLTLDLSNRGLALDDGLLAAAGLPEEHPIRQASFALGLGGQADLDLGLRIDLGSDLTQPRALLEAVDLAAEVRSDGAASFCFNGYEILGPRQGFPLRADRVSAQVVVGLAGRNAHDALVGILDAEASHGTGVVRAHGMIATPRTLRPRGEPDLDLVIEVEDRAVDEDLRAALQGMPGTSWIWDEFAPGDGSLDARVLLRDRAALGGLIAQVDLVARAAPIRWRPLPVDLFVDELELALRWSERTQVDERGIPMRAVGAHWRARGSSASVDDLTVVGMSRDRLPAPGRDSDGLVRDPAEAPLHAVRVAGTGLALRGSDWQGLAEVVEGLDEVTEELGAKGRVDFTWVDHELAGRGTRELALEARPAVVQLLPAEFPVVLRDVAGRLNLSDRGSGDARAHAVVTASWPAGRRLAAHAAVDLSPEPEPGVAARSIQLAAAGLDPRNQALLGALRSREVGAETPLESGEPPPELEGPLDLAGTLTGTEELTPDLVLTLRGNRFRSGPVELDDLRGSLTLGPGGLQGERIRALLAGSPVELLDARFVLDPEPEAAFFHTLLDAEDLPLDRAHMGAFLDAEALDALIEDFDWRGQVDLDRVDLSLARTPEGRLRVALSGHLVPSAMRLVLGAPLEVSRAEVQLEELVLEGSSARAWGSTRGLFGSIAGREVRDARLLFSYVDQRLTIEDLDAQFAGGRLTSPGEGRGMALAVDLAPPHHLALGIELTKVDAGKLLTGAFGGGQNQGSIDASVRLEALPGDLLAATGAGWVRIGDARLFSIPVFRELFTRLGFDATAVFDSMRATFALADGVVTLREMYAHSPLLKLVGEGRWNLDGRLDADLEVRYSVVDKLGPLRVLLYWFQDSIISVSVRGDIYRPVVLLRNSLLDLLGMEDDPGVRLPLPPSSRPRW